MNEREFLRVAAALAAAPTEADWRTCVGRAYYAAFHVARRLLHDLGFVVPRADRAHTYLSLRLQNCGDAGVTSAGVRMSGLRQLRNHADYDLQRPLIVGLAGDSILKAGQIIQILDAARSEPTRTQITGAMRIYERDVLKDVTYQKP